MRHRLDVAKQAAREAGAIALKFYRQMTVSHKSNLTYNLVTTTDLKAEKAILRRIRSSFPDAQFLSEEFHPERAVESSDLWVVDPLDGTNNYVHRFPHFCVSIAYAQKGKVLLGVVYDPVRDEMFCAVHGKGATLNGKRIRTSATRHLQDSLVITGFHYNRGAVMDRTLKGIRDLLRAGIQGIRRTGSAALDLCWIACGRADAYFEYELSPWDYAAGMLIVQEAGGVCTDRRGEPLGLGSTGVIATNGPLHRTFFEKVKWRGPRSS